MAIIENLKIQDFNKMLPLLNDYKKSIGESILGEKAQSHIKNAMEENRIYFFGAKEKSLLVGLCSLSLVFSTFKCCDMGIFEDFYIIPEERHKGIARQLVSCLFDYATKKGCSSVIVGCCASDVQMYKNLGFSEIIGNMLSKILLLDS